VTGVGAVVTRLNRGAAAVRPTTAVAMERLVRTIERDVKRHSLTGKKGRHPLFGVTGAKGDALGVRSGNTRSSVTARVFDTAGTLLGVVGSALTHVRAHELGVTISGRWLRIPTRHAQTGAGVDRYAGMSARQIPDTVLLRGKKGGLWIMLRQGKKLTPLYLLVRSVTLRPRRMFAAALDRNRRAIRDAFARATARVAILSGGK
jgi:hypothetical protein